MKKIAAAVAGEGTETTTGTEGTGNGDAHQSFASLGSLSSLVDPEAIFDYIYAILHTPEYRAKYREFLKTDFPRIPYPKDGETFRRFAAIGAQLRTTHLMKDPMPTLAERTAAFPVAGNNVVDSVRWELCNCENVQLSKCGNGKSGKCNSALDNVELHNCTIAQSPGRVYINDTQYFDNVAQEDFAFFIGGYQPAQKWLKDRKGRTLSADDLLHYKRIILAMQRTGALMAELRMDHE